MSLVKVKGIIFDLGSTLIEYENRPWPDMSLDGQKLAYETLIAPLPSAPNFESFHRRLEGIKDEFRIRARDSLWEYSAAEPPRQLFEEYGWPDAEKLSREFIDLFYTVVRTSLTVEEGARELLAEVKTRGYRLGQISNTIYPPEQHDKDLERFGLKAYFEWRIYSSTFGRRKPHPDIFRAGLERIGLSPEETVYVGDRYYEDVQGAQQAGMGAVLKYCAIRDYPDPMPDGFPVIHAIGELLTILKT